MPASRTGAGEAIAYALASIQGHAYSATSAAPTRTPPA